MVRATVSRPPDMVRFTIETWPCRIAAMASGRWACTGIAPEWREAMARVRAQVLEAYPDSARPYPPKRSSVGWHARSAPAVAAA
jgi:hypothetical protein